MDRGSFSASRKFFRKGALAAETAIAAGRGVGGGREAQRSYAPETGLMFRRELFRAVANGVLDAASATFLVLFAVRYYDVSAFGKSLIAATSSFGYLLSPFMVAWTERLRLRVTNASSALFLASAAFLFLASVSSAAWAYVTFAVAGMAFANSSVALITKLYQENYPADRRGRLLSKTMIVRIGTIALFSQLGAWLLASQPDAVALILRSFALAALVSSVLILGCPVQRQEFRRSPALSTLVREMWRDDTFRNTMICWMLMGLGNLLMLTLRVEYLANPIYGVKLTPGEVAFYVGVLPNVARIVMSSVWGTLFDKINFFTMRILINVSFAIGTMVFFLGNDLGAIAAGALIYGAATAGGDIAWNLWIAKFAPPDRVTHYMSFHAFLTGVRGLIAPLAAFQLITVLSFPQCTAISVALILSASLWLLPERKRVR